MMVSGVKMLAVSLHHATPKRGSFCHFAYCVWVSQGKKNAYPNSACNLSFSVGINYGVKPKKFGLYLFNVFQVVNAVPYFL